ncbi:MAG: creatininase family protein [Anaerolineales bacterium]
MRFEDLNWMDVERYLETDDRVILVIGACEQHGYLSLLTDVRIPMALADAAAQQTGVLVAPPVSYGVSPYFESFSGTVSLKLDTFLQMLTDLVGGFHQQGFHGITVVNGHGGNTAGRERLSELVNELKGLRVFWYSWWRSESVQQIAEAHDRHPGHASWLEHFPFTEVADLPEGDSPMPLESGRVWTAPEIKEFSSDGVMGGPYRSNEDLQHQIYAAALRELIAGVDSLRAET